MNVLQDIKVRLVPSGTRVRTLPIGPFKGNRMEIDLRDQSQYFLGLWERETYPSVRRAMDRCDWMVDAGSQSGEYAIALLRRPGVSRVVAFDPDEAANAVLNRNLQANGLTQDPRFTLVPSLLGGPEDPNCTTIDELDLAPDRIGFIKIDVEGAEMGVLRGAETTLRAGSVDLLVETHTAELEVDCVEYLAGLGYTCRIIPNGWWRRFVPDNRPAEHNRWLWATNVDSE